MATGMNGACWLSLGVEVTDRLCVTALLILDEPLPPPSTYGLLAHTHTDGVHTTREHPDMTIARG